MRTLPCWPDWLDARRLDDDVLASAYEQADAACRACVKNGMALLHALWGESADSTRLETCDGARGFRYVRHETPAPWTLLLLTPAYAAPSRLAAALMPALLAHVPLMGALCVGGQPSASACATLELAGIEHIFHAPQEDAARLLRHMRETFGQGRVLLLHGGELAPLRQVAEAQSLPVWEERRPPLLWMDDAAEHDARLLAWLHPDAAPVPRPDAASAGQRPDAVFVRAATHCTRAVVPLACAAPPSCAEAPSAAQGEDALLLLHPGMEGCWLHPHLTPAFFRQRRIRIAPTEETYE